MELKSHHTFTSIKAKKFGGVAPELREEISKGVVRLQIIKDAAGFDRLENEWNHLAHRSNSSVYQSFAWQNQWWYRFEGNNELRVIAFRDGSKLVGLAPMYLCREKNFGLPGRRILQLIGTTNNLRPQSTPADKFMADIIAEPAYENEVVAMFINYLQRSSFEFDQLILSNTGEFSVIQQNLVPALNKSNLNYTAARDGAGQVLYLGSNTGIKTVDQFISERKLQLRRQMHQLNQLIKKQDVFKVNLIHCREELDYYFPKVMELYRQTNNDSPFKDETYSSFLFDVLQSLQSQGRLLFSVLEAKDQIVAGTICSRQGNQINELLMTYDPAPSFAMYQPGNITRFFIINLAIQHGFEKYHFSSDEHGHDDGITKNAIRTYSVTIESASHSGKPRGLWSALQNLFGMERRY